MIKFWVRDRAIARSLAVTSVILATLFISKYAFPNTEWPKPDFQTCKFYEDAENNLNCGASGYTYLQNYGLHYCREFKIAAQGWSGSLRSWVEKTGLCLQEMIYDNRQKRLSPCKQMEEFAYDSHPICYKQYEICSLSAMDKIRIFNVVRLVDLVSRKALASTLNVIFKCLADIISDEEDVTIQRLNSDLADAPESTKRLGFKIIEGAPLDLQARKIYFSRAFPLLTFGVSASTRSDVSEEFLNNYRKDRLEWANINELCYKSILSETNIPDVCKKFEFDKFSYGLGKNNALKLGEGLDDQKIHKILRVMNVKMSP